MKPSLTLLGHTDLLHNSELRITVSLDRYHPHKHMMIYITLNQSCDRSIMPASSTQQPVRFWKAETSRYYYDFSSPSLTPFLPSSFLLSFLLFPITLAQHKQQIHTTTDLITLSCSSINVVMIIIFCKNVTLFLYCQLIFKLLILIVCSPLIWIISFSNLLPTIT